MMGMLSEPPQRGYPDDFLIARVKGRWAAMRESPHPAGPEPDMEHAWVYARIAESLRKSLRLFFIHGELRRMFICLRYSTRGRSVPGMAWLFRCSVLSEDFRLALATTRQCTEAAEFLGSAFGMGRLAPALCSNKADGGLMELEREVYARVMAEGARSDSEALRGYFGYMADRYNLLALIKAIRLGLEQRPVLVEGGGFGLKALMRAFEERRGDLLVDFARRLSGASLSGPAASVHQGLTRGLLRKSTRLERSHPRDGAVIAHLVRASVLVEDRRVAGLSSGIASGEFAA